eukprot:scaffold30462_cov28-Tisochrysis_lutea.AAC.12
MSRSLARVEAGIELPAMPSAAAPPTPKAAAEVMGRYVAISGLCAAMVPPGALSGALNGRLARSNKDAMPASGVEGKEGAGCTASATASARVPQGASATGGGRCHDVCRVLPSGAASAERASVDADDCPGDSSVTTTPEDCCSSERSGAEYLADAELRSITRASRAWASARTIADTRVASASSAALCAAAAGSRVEPDNGAAAAVGVAATAANVASGARHGPLAYASGSGASGERRPPPSRVRSSANVAAASAAKELSDDMGEASWSYEWPCAPAPSPRLRLERSIRLGRAPPASVPPNISCIASLGPALERGLSGALSYAPLSSLSSEPLEPMDRPPPSACNARISACESNV